MWNRRIRITAEVRNNITAYILISPAVILITLIGVIPIINSFLYSFQHYLLTDPQDIHFIGLENYITLFKDQNFYYSLWNTMRFTVMSVALELIVGFIGAFMMNKVTRVVGVVRTAVLIPWAIPGIIISYMFSYMFNDQLSVINQILITLNVIDSNITWLADKNWAMFAVVIADTWKQFPYVALMLLAGLEVIPVELYESAEVDGAGKIRQFFSITLPNIQPVLLVVLLFRTMGAVRIFDIVYGMTGGGPANSTSTLVLMAYKYLFGDLNFGLGSAMSSIVFIIILIFSIFYISVLKPKE
ncbi:carbohydrate ABC transporter permease [Mahella australiensis]|uniref:Binding-protein-dependent transport systems inner membrane component n=1 Tax=Mahella australiensis (strain DSM 15567 / CIP 107919 / 50-1 BON) TaxID=697281 RepID=F3ZZ54_MAHA5|nr:sugar ABC transporter permease [Mahella australiensis]AEE97836.1 binding-protein-dependent transport systems inner membrane component [Mahella australiensis 50-1 BON]